MSHFSSPFWRDHLENWLTNAALFCIILTIGFLLARTLSEAVRRLATRAGEDPTLPTFLSSLMRYAILFITGVLALGQLGVATGSLVAVLGAAGLAIGLALQSTLSDVAAGVLLLIVRPFRIGDTIDVAPHRGQVQAITLFTTELLSGDRRKITLPNGHVWKTGVVNLSTSAVRRCDLILPISSQSQLAPAKNVLSTLLAQREDVLKEPPARIVSTFMAPPDGSLALMVSFWTPAGLIAGTKPAVMDAAITCLEQNNIAIRAADQAAPTQA